MNFGDALKALKQGKRVARLGWNSKGMWIFLRLGRFDGPSRGFKVGEEIRVDHPSTQNGVSFGLFEAGPGDQPIIMPCLEMKAADGSIVPGWLASQTDMLAEDWTMLA